MNVKIEKELVTTEIQKVIVQLSMKELRQLSDYEFILFETTDSQDKPIRIQLERKDGE